MITDAFHAWVLQKRWSGDTSAYVTFFTRESGLLQCLYKGGRTPKKQSLLSPFTPLWLSVNTRGDWHYVRQIEITSPSFCLPGDALFAAIYMNELLYSLLQPNDAAPELYDAYVQGLQALCYAENRLAIETPLRRFEWALLACCGYSMSLTQDIQSSAIVADKYYRFIAGEGFCPDSQGISGVHILAFAHNKLDDIAVLKAAKLFMRRAIDFALDGKPVKARSLFNR